MRHHNRALTVVCERPMIADSFTGPIAVEIINHYVPYPLSEVFLFLYDSVAWIPDAINKAGGTE